MIAQVYRRKNSTANKRRICPKNRIASGAREPGPSALASPLLPPKSTIATRRRKTGLAKFFASGDCQGMTGVMHPCRRVGVRASRCAFSCMCACAGRACIRREAYGVVQGSEVCQPQHLDIHSEKALLMRKTGQRLATGLEPFTHTHTIFECAGGGRARWAAVRRTTESSCPGAMESPRVCVHASRCERTVCWECLAVCPGPGRMRKKKPLYPYSRIWKSKPVPRPRTPIAFPTSQGPPLKQTY